MVILVRCLTFFYKFLFLLQKKFEQDFIGVNSVKERKLSMTIFCIGAKLINRLTNYLQSLNCAFYQIRTYDVKYYQKPCVIYNICHH